MLEEEHREICCLDDTNDPHGERRFKNDCITAYNEMMSERTSKTPMPQYARDIPYGGEQR